VRSDEFFMQEALRLARKTPTLPYPNPWVGCVVVRNRRIVGRGFHRGVGTAHAEVDALAAAGAAARGASLFVNLEPCCHVGHTPPCTDAILAAGIRRVVYAIRDPNPLVSGKGAAVLRRHGLRLLAGVCAGEAARLNEAYLKFRATGLPFITAKIAASLDGKIATRSGESKWITDDAARRLGRSLRARNQAVLVGINTVLADNPHLGPRSPGSAEPWRVVLDSRLRIPLRARVLQTGRCVVACTVPASAYKQKQIEKRAQVWRFRGRRVPLVPLLRKLAESGIISVLVEGGSEVLGSFCDEALIDRMCWFLAPKIFGSQLSPSAIGGAGVAQVSSARQLRNTSIGPIGNSWEIRGSLSRWALG
jgi:diaminohydroxyphosphoribosylaminopyrimidine deaminase / 5-amino-6-(5-phosphoribosylamino)uracil reductase